MVAIKLKSNSASILSAQNTLSLITELNNLMLNVNQQISKELPKIYCPELADNLFNHPYTKIEYIMRDLAVSSITTTKCLAALVLCCAVCYAKKKSGAAIIILTINFMTC
ncbi:MAG: hypothetical protein ACJAVV_003900 [Alphaproteobacteria bacterium]